MQAKFCCGFLALFVTLIGQVPGQCATVGLYLEADATSVTTGSVVTVSAFLTKSGPSGGGWDLEDEGLLTGGVRLLLDPTSTASASLQSWDISPNSAFDDPFLTTIYYPGGLPPFPEADPDALGGFLAGIDLFSLPVGEGQSTVLLGDFTLTVTGSAGDSVVLTPDVLNPSGGVEGNLGSFGTGFDQLVTAGGSSAREGVTITIASESSAVPEPSSIALWSGLGLMGLVAARRRRKAA